MGGMGAGLDPGGGSRGASLGVWESCHVILSLSGVSIGGSFAASLAPWFDS
jgi:hypothetical protein